MDMELQRVMLEGYRPICDTMFSHEETLESIVPDACPDISRIVSASGRAFLKEKELGEGTLRMRGSAQVTVLYIPEGEILPRALDLSIPFQCVKDDPKFYNGLPVQATVDIASADARTVNPRKVLLRVNLAIWVAVYDQERRMMSCDVCGEDGNRLEKRFSPAKCYIIPEVREKAFAFSDVLRPTASRPEIEELLACRTELGALDAKFIGKKLVLKGSIQLSILYRSGDGLASVRFEMPYSQILDLGDVPDEAEPDVTVCLQSVDCRLQDGAVEVSLEALAQAALWSQRSVTLLNDAYGIGQPVDVERNPVKICTMAEHSVHRELARTMCESGIPAKQVLDCAVSLTSISEAPADGGVEFTAQINGAILYLSEDDALCNVETTIPVSCRVEVPGGCSCACRCRPIGEVTAVPVTGGVEVRFEAEFGWTILRDEQVNCVTDLSPSETKAADMRPSVIIRRIEEGEALWDVAKSCGSAVSDICGANDLPSEEVPVGTLLLIPTRRD